MGSKTRADDNPGLKREPTHRFSGDTFRSPQPNISQIFPSLLMPGDGGTFVTIISHSALYDRPAFSLKMSHATDI